MNCCGNHNDEGNNGAEHSKHRWMMIVCCVLPVILFVAYLLLNGTTGSRGNLFPFLILLMCPLSHLILMPLMGKKRH